jgi:phage terminase large subunit-like protein
MLQFGLRLGEAPIQVITTTPRPIAVLREIIKSTGTIITRGHTNANYENLPDSFLRQVVGRYEGTRLGRQELNAEILDDNPHALWKRDQLDKLRIVPKDLELHRTVVAIDPSGTSGDENDIERAADVGIIVAGRASNGNCYVIADRTCNLSPAGWGKAAVEAYHEFDADLIIAERNFGGAMVKHVIRTTDPNVPSKEMRTWRVLQDYQPVYGQSVLPGVFRSNEMCSFG